MRFQWRRIVTLIHSPRTVVRAPSPTRSSAKPIDHTATKAWVKAVATDAKALQGQAENLQYSWAGVLAQGSQAQGYALDLDQVALFNLKPDAAKLTKLLQTKAGHVAPADAQLERNFGQSVKQWQHVAALAHAIKTTAQKYNSDAKTSRAIDAFESALDSTETLWNETVAALWLAAGIAPPPSVDTDCSPAVKGSCHR